MLNKLMPSAVWHAFEEILRIPRGRGNGSRIADYIYNEALNHGLNAHMDDTHNVVVWVPATKGRSQEMPVILKARIDKADIKAEETEHEFEEDAFELAINGDWVSAEGAILGAEDGIGVAMMMAIFRDRQLSHPALEMIFATNENLDMSCVEHIDAGHLKGRRLICLDHEKDCILINGTAGVMHTEMSIPIQRDALVQCEALHLHLYGLKGGHSALQREDIPDNAIQIMGRLLTEVKDESDLIELISDQPTNRIPSAAEALIITETPIGTAEKISELFENIRMESKALADARLDIEEKIIEDTTISKKSFEKLMAAIALMPVGVMAKDEERHIVTVSNNMCSFKTEDEMAVIGSLTRYAYRSLGENFTDRLNFLAELIGAQVNIIENIPVWEPSKSSKLLDISSEAFTMRTDHIMEASFNHGALLRAVISVEGQNTGTITIEPDVMMPHTINEAVSITSVQRSYNLLKSILASVGAH